MSTEIQKKHFQYGFKRGLPIMIGYLPVSFAFGITAVKVGIPPLMAIFMSLSNLTSAGQFAGTMLIADHKGYFEIALTTFIINIRYMLMSLSLSQKLDRSVTLLERMIISFAITDESFAVSSNEKEPLTYHYMIGLVSGPIFGWTVGTALGAFICSALPEALSSLLGIALYGMFIAIIIPPCKHSKQVFAIIVLSCILSCLIKYIKLFSFISAGFRVIIVTLITCSLGAFFFPLKQTTEENS